MTRWRSPAVEWETALGFGYRRVASVKAGKVESSSNTGSISP